VNLTELKRSDATPLGGLRPPYITVEFSVHEGHFAYNEKRRTRYSPVCPACNHGWTFHHAIMNFEGVVLEAHPGAIGRGIPMNCISKPMPLPEFIAYIRSFEVGK